MNVKDKVCVVTGAAGLLGFQFSDALLQALGIVYLLDINRKLLKKRKDELDRKYRNRCFAMITDITDENNVRRACKNIIEKSGRVDVLINNAANNPKVEKSGKLNSSRLENFRLKQWEEDLLVGLTGAFLCCKIFGHQMAKKKSGVIINIASDLSVIAPDQRIYRKASLAAHQQLVKPVTYSVIKTGLLGLTRYLATYWADCGIRVNALSPGGVYSGQPSYFVKRLKNLIPMRRMADVREYREAVLFLASDASKYMTGQNLIIDGGRSVW